MMASQVWSGKCEFKDGEHCPKSSQCLRLVLGNFRISMGFKEFMPGFGRAIPGLNFSGCDPLLIRWSKTRLLSTHQKQSFVNVAQIPQCSAISANAGRTRQAV